MKVEISVAEMVQVFKEIQEQPGKILEMVRADMPKVVGEYLSDIMQVELTRFLGRKPYERMEEEANHRNGSYPRNFALKGIGEVAVKVPRDRKGEYRTQVIPKSKQYEDELRQDIAVMFLSGVSTRTLSMISHRLIGHTRFSPLAHLKQIAAGEQEDVPDKNRKVIPSEVKSVPGQNAPGTHNPAPGMNDVTSGPVTDPVRLVLHQHLYEEHSRKLTDLVNALMYLTKIPDHKVEGWSSPCIFLFPSRCRATKLIK